ncbi:MAG: hypothetical protein F6K23_15960 [Okeania sp. SIO2C9]|uniref:hypothetical protein n=1 Tax=Okeania sp. SIO2C9 TaxID=2607791 RepID=UPI0013C14E1B|nr:hypothetical protein [Okeania sp. SIO2C9]NEQ74393.1 hypothetical protein [Okeania sp. SIO2C9]
MSKSFDSLELPLPGFVFFTLISALSFIILIFKIYFEDIQVSLNCEKFPAVGIINCYLKRTNLMKEEKQILLVSGELKGARLKTYQYKVSEGRPIRRVNKTYYWILLETQIGDISLKGSTLKSANLNIVNQINGFVEKPDINSLDIQLPASSR